MSDDRKHVVIVGAGFAGLFASKKLFGKNVRVTVIDRNNYHTFNPLLYQVGAAEIEADQIAYPVRSVFRKKRNVDFFMASLQSLKFKKNTVVTDRGEINYDYLILAPGSTSNFFGTKGADKNTLTLKSMDDAIYLRNHILHLFEKASRCEDPAERKKCLSFVVVGGGPTGVEFAGAFAELVNGPLKKDFPNISASEVNITVVDMAKQLVSIYSEKSALYVKRRLEKLGVAVRLNTGVEKVNPGEIFLKDGSSIKSHTILWTAGVSGVEYKSDVKLPYRRDFRITVDQFMRPEGFENVFICGDMGFFMQGDKPLPMNAPVASQQGTAAAENILNLISGKEMKPFSYSDRGAMVTVGRNSAVTKYAGFEMRGFFAWIFWIFVHIFYLIGFRNKVLVLFSWFRDYLFYERSGRMIIPSDMK